MKFSNKKFLLLVGSLAILFSILAFATWNINQNSGASSLVQKTSTGSIHSSAQEETGALELSDSFMKHMEPLMKMFEDRISLLAETVKMNSSAPQEGQMITSSNTYISLGLSQVNTYQDLLNVKAKVNAPLFLKDFADRACPISPSVLSSSGALMTPAAQRELLVQYYIQSSPAAVPMHYIVHSSPFGSTSEVTKDLFLDGSLSLVNLPAGSYNILAIPGCMSIGGTSEMYPAAAIQDTFEKKADPLEIYSEENNTDPLFKILSPAIDVKTPGKAMREISYTTSSQGKSTVEKLSVPYIQTEPTLQIKAESILPQGVVNASGALLQEKKYYTQFTLYNKEGSIVATTESQKVLTPVKSTKTTWYGYFSKLPKGEYTLISRLILESTDADNTTQEIVKRSKVGTIGIGDIYIALGDGTLTGYDGEAWSDEIGADKLQGRGKAQPTKECETAAFLKTACKDQTRLLYGMTSSLTAELTQKKGYPVFILNEGMPLSLTLDKFAQYIGGAKTGLKDRYAQLMPTGILIQVSASTLPENAKSNLDEMRKIFVSIKENIALLKGIKDIPVYYAIPQYEENNTLSETFALQFKQYMSQETGFLPGPNLYKLFFEKLLSEKSANLYRQNAEETRLVNDLGLKEVAGKWVDYIQ
ncbi:MAG: hypothetical protein ACK4NC_00310 [Candidatus Gracilibacteria bacterium]